MNFSTRLILPLIIIMILQGLTSVALISDLFNESLTDENYQWSQVITKSLAESIALNTINNEPLLVREVINKIADDNPSISYIVVTNFDGGIFTHSFTKGFPKHLKPIIDKNHLSTIFNTNEEKILDISHPVIKGLTSYIHLGINISKIQSITNSVKQNIFLITLIFSLIAIVTFTLIVLYNNRPLKLLSTLMEKFGHGENVNIIDPRGAPKEIALVIKSFNDMTTIRDEAIKQLHEQKALFESIFENIPDALILASPDRKIVSVNKAFENIFGYTESEILDKKTSYLYGDEDEYNKQGQLRYNLDSQSELIPYTVSYKRKDGNVFFGETLGTKIKLENNEVLGFIGVVRDITDRKKDEKELKSFKTTLDLISDGVFMFTPDELNFTYCNQSALDQVEYSIDEVSQMKPFDIKPEFDEPSFRLMIQPLLTEEKPFLIFETIHQSKTGKRIPVEIFLQYIHAENDTPRFVAIIRDITERKIADSRIKAQQDSLEQEVEDRTKELRSAKEEAELANNAKSDFLSRMSHELRTPMNAILGFAQILEFDQTIKLSDDQKESVKQILDAGQHLLELINEILDLAKIESGKFEIQLAPVELRSVIDNSLSFISPQALQANIVVTNKFSRTEDLWVNSDKLRLKQVLINLLSNAIKYNKPNGSVTISAHKKDNEKIRIEVSDTGFGIQEKNLNLIFKPFERLNNKNVVEGTGIGLAITKHLIEMMNGEMGVTSSEQGTTFWFELYLSHNPKNKITDTSSEQDQAVISEGENTTFTAVYVEDQLANLKLVQKLFSLKDNLTLHSAMTPTDGFEKIKSHKPDLIILDINLPEMSGIEMLAEIKKDPVFSNTPIIALSANAMQSEINDALNAGFDEYITKPIQVVQFFELIDKYSKDT